MVDIDRNELNKKRGLIIDYKVQNNVKDFIDRFINKKSHKISKRKWLDKCFDWKNKYPLVQKSFLKEKSFDILKLITE